MSRHKRSVWQRRVVLLASTTLTAAAVGLPLAVAGAPGRPVGAVGLDPSTPAQPTTVPVPSAPIDAPASVSDDVRRGPQVGKRLGDAARRASVADIPDAAFVAYHRAATVLNASDSDCRATWELIAAIGRVESNHGRFAGSHLDTNGVATPPILGLPLDGTHGTSRITDTDAGELDGDTDFDRAVGPMQFIPSTWATVGVDGDGDERRDPQDIDDAAMSTAVYLCSGDDDLGTSAGARAAVYRYNHSDAYVDLVLSFARAYAAGTPSVRPFVSTPDLPVDEPSATPTAPPAPTGDPTTPTPEPSDGWASDDPTPTPEETGTPGRPSTTPSEPEPSPPATSSEPAPSAAPTGPPEPSAAPSTSAPPSASPASPSTSPASPSPTTAPDPDLLAAAAEYCTEQGLVDDPEADDDPFDTCVADYLASSPVEPTETSDPQDSDSQGSDPQAPPSSAPPAVTGA